MRRIVSPLEFDPKAAGGEDAVVRIDEARVAATLARRQRKGDSASAVSGWDQSFRG